MMDLIINEAKYYNPTDVLGRKYQIDCSGEIANSIQKFFFDKDFAVHLSKDLNEDEELLFTTYNIPYAGSFTIKVTKRAGYELIPLN